MAVGANTVQSTRALMQDKLAGIVPDFEIEYKAEIAFAVNQLKRERGAVILGHNYMEPALYHTVCDFHGDSLELSRIAARTDADPIVFCGVRFMAETAKILNPQRTVLLPAKVAGCSLASSISAADVRALRERYPGVPIVAYVNTYADVKAEVDVCCTSSNAQAVVDSLDSDTVIFLPDEYLARNVARDSGRQIILPGNRPVSAEHARRDAEIGLEHTLIGWQGRCEVHEQFTPEDVANVRRQFPDVVVLAHPECSPEVVDAADFSGSTGAMIAFVNDAKAGRYLLLTECAMGDNIAAEARDKEMLRLCSVRCPHMNEITLENVLESLRDNVQQIEVEEDIRRRALGSIERMLAIG